MKNTKLLSVITTIFLLLAVGGAAPPVVQDEQAQATPVIDDLQGQTTPGGEVFRLNAPSAELTGECFEVDPPCGWQNCTSLGTNYSCFNPDTCCCPGKMCEIAGMKAARSRAMAR
jgi:hypothetical protein